MSPARPIRGTTNGRSSAAALAVTMAASLLLLSCRDDAVSPAVESPAQFDEVPVEDVPGAFLTQEGAVPTGLPLYEQIITVPVEEGTFDPIEVTLWEEGEVTGPVVVEVTSNLALETSEVMPAQDPINYGLVVWWEVAEIIFTVAAALTDPPADTLAVGRPVSLELYAIEDAATHVVDTTFWAGSTSTLYLLDAGAADHGFGIRWNYAEDGLSYGSEFEDPDCIDFFFRCVPAPEMEGRTGEGPLSGTLEVRVYEASAVAVTIESTTTSGAQSGSFISAAPENEISHTGSVTPSALTPTLAWSVDVLTPRSALVVGPSGGAGEAFDWTVPAQSEDRYAGYTHDEALAAIGSPDPHPNALRFGVTLSATDGGQEYASETAVVVQDAADALRQEYVDYGRLAIPERASLGSFQTDHFSAGELNFGDYEVFLATGAMRTGLEAVRASLNARAPAGSPEIGLTLTSAFRNPVHHVVHAEATSPESQHQYGTAVDVRIHDHPPLTREEFFEMLLTAARAADVGVCWEPEATIRSNGDGVLTHAHMDWRAACASDWRLN